MKMHPSIVRVDSLLSKAKIIENMKWKASLTFTHFMLLYFVLHSSSLGCCPHGSLRKNCHTIIANLSFSTATIDRSFLRSAPLSLIVHPPPATSSLYTILPLKLSRIVND